MSDYGKPYGSAQVHQVTKDYPKYKTGKEGEKLEMKGAEKQSCNQNRNMGILYHPDKQSLEKASENKLLSDGSQHADH